MITIGANGKKIAYGIKHYNLDTEADLTELQTRVEPMGSTCFIISNSKYYMLNSKKQWVEITPFGKVITSSGDGDNILPPEEDDSEPEIPNDDIVYDGGIL